MAIKLTNPTFVAISNNTGQRIVIGTTGKYANYIYILKTGLPGEFRIVRNGEIVGNEITHTLEATSQ